MSSDNYVRHYILFAFQLKKNVLETEEMICSALGENAVSESTYKKWYKKFRTDNFDLSISFGSIKKSWRRKIECCSYCKKILENTKGACWTIEYYNKRFFHRLQKLERKLVVESRTCSIQKTKWNDIAICLLLRFKQKNFLSVDLKSY